MKNFLNKLFILFFLLLIMQVQSSDQYLETRFGVGPAWHNFYSLQNFVFDPPLKSPDLEMFKELNFDLMFYAEGMIRWFSGDYLNAQIIAGGGALHRGQITINDYVAINPEKSLQFVKQTVVDGSVATIDVNIGTEFYLETACLWFNPLLGFLYNKENLFLCAIGNVDTYKVNNAWRGGYIGTELALYASEALRFKALYKFVVGGVKSILDVHATPTKRLIIPHPSHSVRSARMFGSVVGFEFRYNHSRCWHLGSTIVFSHYRNHDPGCVSLSEQVPLLKQTRLQKIFWEELAWTFFAEYWF